MASDLLSFESSVQVITLQTEKKKQSHLNRIRMVPPCVKITTVFLKVWGFPKVCVILGFGYAKLNRI